MTPRQIVQELDRYIVGQDAAKRAVAIAIRNRWRRQQLPPELRKDVTPKNIIMIRDLTEIAIGLVRQEQRTLVETQAKERVTDRLVDLLVPNITDLETESPEDNERMQRTRDKMRARLEAGELEDRLVELNLEQKAVPVQIFSNLGLEQMDVDFQNMFERIMPKQNQQRQLPIREARRLLLEQETEALIDRQVVAEKAIELVENSGMIFLDELDKICGPQSSHGPDVSRQGVQRDLLPVVEGTTVNTRYGPVRSDHILFIAAGAFHLSKPSDLMPELQGRFPIRVELTDLKKEDFLRILTEPKHSLTKQYVELLGTEGVKLEFTDDGILALADIAFEVNRTAQNIGARRLHTILERVVEKISFEGPDLKKKKVVIDGAYVHGQLAEIMEKEDLSKFIL